MSREVIENLRRDMMRNMVFARLGGSFADPGFMVSADGVKWAYLQYRYDHFGKPSYAEIARDIGMNDEHLRLIMLGKREPSTAFLKAAGFERVVMYRHSAALIASRQSTSGNQNGGKP
jgi:hypothetical protein